MSLITFVEEEKLPAADLNANFTEASLAGFYSFIAGEALTAKDSVCLGYYQADGGITFDAKVEKHGTIGTGGGTATQSFTVGNHTNRVLIVAVNYSSTNEPTGVTFNGDAMTELTVQNYSSGNWCLKTYVLFAPDIATGDVVVTFGASGATENYCFVAYSYYNVAQAVHASADMDSSTSSPTLTITPTVDGVLIFSVIGGGGTQVISGSTNIFNNVTDNETNASLYAGDSGFVYPKKATVCNGGYGGSYVAMASIALAPITAPTFAAVLKTDGSALANACNLDKANNFAGFVQANASAGATVVVQTKGVVTGLSGLNPFQTYYVSDTNGAIANAAGTISKKVGRAISTTELLIINDNA